MPSWFIHLNGTNINSRGPLKFHEIPIKFHEIPIKFHEIPSYRRRSAIRPGKLELALKRFGPLNRLPPPSTPCAGSTATPSASSGGRSFWPWGGRWGEAPNRRGEAVTPAPDYHAGAGVADAPKRPAHAWLSRCDRCSWDEAERNPGARLALRSTRATCRWFRASRTAPGTARR